MPRERAYRTLATHYATAIDQSRRELYQAVSKYRRWRDDDEDGYENELMERLTNRMWAIHIRLKNLKRERNKLLKDRGVDHPDYMKKDYELFTEIVLAERFMDEFAKVSYQELGFDMSYGIIDGPHEI